jgi:coenzyme F420-0:L-glutamate ligase / coenzyme F420-1:gamma-L-glutamate ligase
VSPSRRTLTFTAVENIPMIKEGNDLCEIIIKAMNDQKLIMQEGDILVIAQKVISKAEGRQINFSRIIPSAKALELAEITQKDARFIELVLSESKNVVRAKFNTLIVEHKNGFICANAGIDHSNVVEVGEDSENWVLLLPENSDESANKIRVKLEKFYKLRIGILIIDSHGRAWRNGTVGMTIGLSGLPALIDLRGNEDLFGFHLKSTTLGAADELAAGASLLMGQAAEGTPVIHVRGFPYKLRDAKLDELIRPISDDLFR